MYLHSSILLLTTIVISTQPIPYTAAHRLFSLESPVAGSRNLSTSLFASLEELSRIVDISYCVGVTGIYHPFSCVSRCHEFPHFELVDTWNTGPLMSDSCGYIAVDHGHNIEQKGRGTGQGRIIVAFRGTYSLANTIVDLSTIPQEYVPYPADPGRFENPPPARKHRSFWDSLPWPFHGSPLPTRFSEIFQKDQTANENAEEKCTNCTVHTGFYTSYTHTRPLVIPYLEELKTTYPDYDLHLVGHSLGGAVAGLMGLECEQLGWNPTVTTFGEPRFGNKALIKFLDKRFDLGNSMTLDIHGRYRRVTHVDDPVPLLPLREWGYRMHAGEIYISKAELSPAISDIRLCAGDKDEECIAGAEGNEEVIDMMTVDATLAADSIQMYENTDFDPESDAELEARGWFSSRFRLWQLFFAHRDYFWRLGLCVPGGDPLNLGRQNYPDAEVFSNDEL